MCNNPHSNNINSYKRILFFDDGIFEKNDFCLVQNSPDCGDIVIRADKPWEDKFIAFYLTAVEDEGRLKMWYTCRDKENRGSVAYAESCDGINWIKPELGVVEYNGSFKNNLVGISDLEGTVLLDRECMRGPKYRYFTSKHGKGIFSYESDDGIRWRFNDRPILEFVADSQNHAFFDSKTGKYTAYLRGWKDYNVEGKKTALRTVVRTELRDDFTHYEVLPAGRGGYRWKDSMLPAISTELRTVFECDEKDGKSCDVYTMAVHQYPLENGYYLAFPGLYSHFAPPPVGKYGNDGRIEVHFLGSTDGIKWRRYSRMPYIAPGIEGSDTANMLFMGIGMITNGDSIFQYGTGYRTTHGDNIGRIKNTDGVIIRYKQRIDGFLSADAAEKEKEMILKTFVFKGEKLMLNYDAGVRGMVKVEIKGADDVVIKGFSMNECNVIEGNSTAKEISWGSGRDIKELNGMNIKIKLTGVYTKIYSLIIE